MERENIFDRLIDRRGTASLKWEKYPSQVLPMWVADMDFPSPPAVIQALIERARHGIYGYTLPPRDLPEVVMAWLHRRYGWQIEPDWLVWLPGLVCGLNIVCRAVGNAGDAVITLTPIYPPFLSAPQNQQRVLSTCQMHSTNGKSCIDFFQFERMLTPNTKLFLFCNPHNPTGRVFSREELERTAEVCLRHNLIICSDEVHCDLILDADKRHIPLASLDPEIARRTVTLMAPSKTFNLPGLGLSFAVISDLELRRQFKRAMEGIVPWPNLFGYTAALAAYRDGEEWLRELLIYLRGNRDLLVRRINAMPALSCYSPEATYLAWIDAQNLPVENPHDFFLRAGVGLSDGVDFGAPRFLRMNFGCPRKRLEEALQIMAAALNELQF
ncbi:MAG: PatB family C-S lyase [candidate division KSB1 bacterium]|nr:PatB family C-S lyase [candidate division KSB1 bacterium]